MSSKTVNNLDQVQKEIKEWRDTQFGPCPTDTMMRKLMEEVGELASAMSAEKGSREDFRDAVGDVMVMLLGISEEFDVSLAECLDEVWAVVKTRDYRKYPGKGRA